MEENKNTGIDYVEELEPEQLEDIAGGANKDSVHDKNNFVARTVCNLPAGTYLVMQVTPGGRKMSVRYSNGNTILIHKSYTKGGYLFAYSYEHRKYGYVDSRYVR